MQYLEVKNDMTLSDLSAIVGERNVDSVLNANGLKRSVNVGKQFYDRVHNEIEPSTTTVDAMQKVNIINQFVKDSDLYQKAYLGTSTDWKSLAQYNCFSDAIRIPDEYKVPDSADILGDNTPIPDRIYKQTMATLKADQVDPTIFSEYDASYSGSLAGIYTDVGNGGSLSEWFLIPFGAVCLRSYIDDEILYFPVYPEELEDGVTANYDEMSEMLYQYEPWKVYKSSGPREITFTFKFHRDMWSGDHRDGCANHLIRGCEANCYPDYNGSLVNVPMVTMYIEGENFITGVMTSCKVNWHGPLGLDRFYLFCDLTLTIVEVSPTPLSFNAIKEKELLA